MVCLYVLFPEASSGLFFLSQRPYIPQASLRQQVLYPTPMEEAVQVTDEHIKVRRVFLTNKFFAGAGPLPTSAEPCSDLVISAAAGNGTEYMWSTWTT